MVEQDAVGGVHAVGLAVVHHDPVGVEFGRRIGAAGIEGGGLALRDFLDLAVELRSRGLIEAALLVQAQDANGFEQPQGADGVGVGGVLGGFEADRDVRLGGQIIDLVRLNFLDDADQIGAVGQVAIVQDKPLVGLVRVLIQMFDAAGIE